MPDVNPSPRLKPSRSTLTQGVLSALIAGAGVDEISAAEKLTRKRTEAILREALRNRWVAPAEKFARLQIARLKRMMIVKLRDRSRNGELMAIDRALKVAGRLDRYHGFTKAMRPADQFGEEDRARLLKKLNELADHLQPEKPAE